MKNFWKASALILLGVCAFAQHRTGRGGAVVFRTVPPEAQFRNYGSRTGFGNVVFPGTGTAPNPFSITDPSFAYRVGRTVSGFPIDGHRGRGGYYGGGYYGGAGIIPYPVFVGGYGDGYDASAQQVPPNITIINMPPSAPPVTINQGSAPEQAYTPETARPMVRDYASGNYGLPQDSGMRVYEAPNPQRPEAAPSANEQVMFMIALKDSSVYTAVAYWVQDDKLHFITTQGGQEVVPLSEVDRQLSNRLNKGRKVQFALPPEKQ